ncbi:hypothetical protein ACHMW6_24015 [Pseudoduganella sp. UC29_106]|uniref:hypothetical protein n=1 Tax=Pseudoduganella sp. UC29_106 TaxID=3374553 RepID=UPI003757FED2
MQTTNGKIAGFMAGVAVVRGISLLGFIIVFLQLTAALDAGNPQNGDAIGLAIMSVLAYGLALLSLLAALVYFMYKRVRHQQRPKSWHLIAMSWTAVEVVAPVLYFVLH